jgi:hypothetical protein
MQRCDMMKKENVITIIIICFSALILLGCKKENNKTQQIYNEIAQSHIQGNVPDENNYDVFMERDLNKYFSNQYSKEVNVEWEFLREGATQTGIAYPKYYLWVKIYDQTIFLSEGAVRLAAIDKKEFNITHFVDITDIKNQNIDIYSIFPQPVCDKIKLRLVE